MIINKLVYLIKKVLKKLNKYLVCTKKVMKLALLFKTKTMKPQTKLLIVLILVMYLVGLLQDIHSL